MRPTVCQGFADSVLQIGSEIGRVQDLVSVGSYAAASLGVMGVFYVQLHAPTTELEG